MKSSMTNSISVYLFTVMLSEGKQTYNKKLMKPMQFFFLFTFDIIYPNNLESVKTVRSHVEIVFYIVPCIATVTLTAMDIFCALQRTNVLDPSKYNNESKSQNTHRTFAAPDYLTYSCIPICKIPDRRISQYSSIYLHSSSSSLLTTWVQTNMHFVIQSYTEPL